MFYNGLTSEQHNEARREVYNRRLANNPNDSYALYMLGLLEDNKAKSEQLYIRAAQLGSIEAMSGLGSKYSEYSNSEPFCNGFGHGEEKSRYWYKQAADTGDPKCLVDYAIFCLGGVEQRDEKISYLKRAAESGYWKGMYELAQCYNSPIIGERTKDKVEYAKYWYLSAIELCNNPSDTYTFSLLASSLGHIYGDKFLSKQVPPNTDFEDACEAVKWFVYAYVFDYPCKDDITRILDYCGINFTDEDFQALRDQAVRKFYSQ